VPHVITPPLAQPAAAPAQTSAPRLAVARELFASHLFLPSRNFGRRQRLPAFGKDLRARRHAGVTPKEIALVYGDDWRDVPPPKIGVKPQEFRIGRYDWSALAGVMVTIIDLQVSGDDVFYLMAEVVAARAYVRLREAIGGRHDERGAEDWARSYRIADPLKKRFVWPLWWSDELEAAQRAASDDWVLDRARERGLSVDDNRAETQHGGDGGK